MFFDLNVPVPRFSPQNTSKKGKQPQRSEGQSTFSTAQISGIEARVDILVHCQSIIIYPTFTEQSQVGYSVIAFSQTVLKKVDSKSHFNFLDSLLSQLRPRPGILYLKRLNIILDQDSEKGFGLINANIPLFNGYDLIALIPTTHATFSSACLTHSLPSQLTAHIIALPLTLPRLPYHLKHTLIRTAIKNGATFEINYVGALGGESDATLVEANLAESGPSAKRNWWAATRELVRVTKGKGLIISGGAVAEADLRPPRDVANLIAILGLAQDSAHEASTKVPKSLIVRAQTRKTYRAVLSEPKLVVPCDDLPTQVTEETSHPAESTSSFEATIPQKRIHELTGPEPNDPISQGTGFSHKKKRKKNQKSEKTIM